ncbi:hypothetical protein Tco_0684622 [Tanacetum coccineum]
MQVHLLIKKKSVKIALLMLNLEKMLSTVISLSKDVGNSEPKSATDDQKLVENGPHNESDEKDKSEDDSSPNNAEGRTSAIHAPQVWKHVDLPNGKKAIGTKWVFRNKKYERGIVITNKARWSRHFMGYIKLRRACVILKKFNYTDVKSASTLVDLEKPLVKDGDADDVDVHLYRSMIGSLMYLTTSRPDIMFAVCACARFQVTPKTSHLLAVKRIFRYLKGKPTLGLWYSKDSPFELVAYTDSDYAGATQDRKSTTRGCQFFRNWFDILWAVQEANNVVAPYNEAGYVVYASCCGTSHLDSKPIAGLWANQEEGVDSGIPTDSQQTSITIQPSSFRPQKK